VPRIDVHVSLEPVLNLPSADAMVRRSEHAERVQAALDASLAAGTRRNYEGARIRLGRWAAAEGFVDPYSPEALASYVSWLADQGRSVSAVTTLIAAVRNRALEQRLDVDSTADPTLRRVVAGLTRTIGRQHQVKRARAFTTEEVRRIVEVCGDEPAGRRDAMAVSWLFAGAFRRSELAEVRRGQIKLGSDGAAVTIATSKTDQGSVGATVGIVRGKVLDPIAIANRWLAVRGRMRADDPVFVRISRSGKIVAPHRPLTGESIGEIIQRRAAEAGLGDGASGHSGRRSHVTVALRNGADSARVAKTTRHRSLSSLLSYADEVRVLETTTSADLGL
jgi:integrase